MGCTCGNNAQYGNALVHYEPEGDLGKTTQFIKEAQTYNQICNTLRT